MKYELGKIFGKGDNAYQIVSYDPFIGDYVLEDDNEKRYQINENHIEVFLKRMGAIVEPKKDEKFMFDVGDVVVTKNSAKFVIAVPVSRGVKYAYARQIGHTVTQEVLVSNLTLYKEPAIEDRQVSLNLVCDILKKLAVKDTILEGLRSEIDKTSDPEYKEFLRLKEKFL